VAPIPGPRELADVARLEWAVNRALHAADTPRLDLARPATLDQAAMSQLRFTMHPAVSVLRLEFPADAIGGRLGILPAGRM
jgi:hypothetical protein